MSVFVFISPSDPFNIVTMKISIIAALSSCVWIELYKTSVFKLLKLQNLSAIAWQWFNLWGQRPMFLGFCCSQQMSGKRITDILCSPISNTKYTFLLISMNIYLYMNADKCLKKPSCHQTMADGFWDCMSTSAFQVFCFVSTKARSDMISQYYSDYKGKPEHFDSKDLVLKLKLQYICTGSHWQLGRCVKAYLANKSWG